MGAPRRHRPPLHNAALADSPERVRRCLQREPHTVRTTDLYGNLALHMAAGVAGPMVVDALLDAAPDTADAVNSMGDTPLHCAAYGGNARAVRQLTARAPGTLVAINLAGDTPLMAATRSGHGDVARQLLAAAPSAILLPDGQGRTPLQVAAGLYGAAPDQPSRAQLVLTLLSRTHPDADDALQHGLLCTLLDTAAQHGHAAVARRVLELDPATAAPRRRPHPIHLAATGGDAGVLEALLEVNPELALLEGEHGRLPVHEATSSGDPSAVEALLRAAPTCATHLSRHGLSPLAFAASAGNPDVVRVLLRAAPDMVALQDGCGRLPAHLVTWSNSAEATTVILAAAPDLAGALDSFGHAPLHHAAQVRSARSVEALLAHSPHLARQLTADGQSSLELALGHDAAGCDDEATAAVLLPVLRREPSLATVHCLHRALQLGLPACARVLLAAAPDTVQQANGLGQTAIDVALGGVQAEAAEVVASTRHPDPLLLFLQLASFGAPAEVFVRAIEAHVPLPAECWRVVPAPLTGLLTAMPTVLERGGEDDVGEAVAHMMPRDRQFLRDSLRALHRASRALPTDVTRHIMSLAC